MAFDPIQEAREIIGETEFYDFDFGGGIHEYYTTARKDVLAVFGASRWKAIPIHRDGLEFDKNTDGTKTKLVLPVKPRFVEIVAQAGLDTVSLKIIRGFGRDYVNDYRNPWFLGYLTDLNIGVNIVEGNLRSVMGLFGSAIPRLVYKSGCNNRLFDPVCALIAAGFQETVTILTVAAGGRLITVSGQLTLTNDHYTFGRMKRTTDQLWRHITQQAGNQFVLHTPILGLVPGMSVHLLPGCDLAVNTCITKFGNKQHFTGMANMPTTNPTIDGF